MSEQLKMIKFKFLTFVLHLHHLYQEQCLLSVILTFDRYCHRPPQMVLLARRMQRNGTISALLHWSRHTFAEIEEKSQFCRKSTICFRFYLELNSSLTCHLIFSPQPFQPLSTLSSLTFQQLSFSRYLQLSTSIISNSHPSMCDGS